MCRNVQRSVTRSERQIREEAIPFTECEIEVCAVRNQQLARFQMPFLSGHVERRGLVDIEVVRVAAMCEEQLDDRSVAVNAGKVERAVLVRIVQMKLERGGAHEQRSEVNKRVQEVHIPQVRDISGFDRPNSLEANAHRLNGTVIVLHQLFPVVGLDFTSKDEFVNLHP